MPFLPYALGGKPKWKAEKARLEEAHKVGISWRGRRQAAGRQAAEVYPPSSSSSNSSSSSGSSSSSNQQQ